MAENETQPRMTIGRNSESGQLLERYVERIEQIRAEKKDMTALEAAEMARAKSDGFVPAAIRFSLKARSMKPHDRQEAMALQDTYLHALGMAEDTPLFRSVGLMAVDTSSREEVIEAFKKLVPDNGSITVEVKGKSVRLFRDPKTDEVTVHDVIERPAGAEDLGPALRAEKRPAPYVDSDGAEELGHEAFKANEPIIGNPFPFGDARRARWDKGWRDESGGDGMGPSTPKKPGKPGKED